MFASAQADHGNAARVSESVRKALEEGQVKVVMAAILGGTRDDKGKGNAMMKGPGGASPTAQETPPAAPDLAGSMDSLRAALKVEIEKGQTPDRPGASADWWSACAKPAFFASGDDAVYPGTYPSIEKIARAIAALPSQVRLEGHTDSVPIHNSRFRSNWELSAARSIAMLELLVSRFDIPPRAPGGGRLRRDGAGRIQRYRTGTCA